MSFLTTIEHLCTERGESLYDLADAIGMGGSMVTGWRQGAKPRPKTAKKIADHFGVTVDYLFAEGDEIENVVEPPELTSQERQIINMYRDLTELGKMRMCQAILRVYDEETNR